MSESRSSVVLQKIAIPFFLVLAYFVFLLLLSAGEVLQATHRIAEQVRTTETTYRLKDDALEAIRLDVYKIAVAARDALLNERPQEADAVVVECVREIESQLQFLQQDANKANVAQLQKIDGDLHVYMRAVYSITRQRHGTGSNLRLVKVLPQRLAILDILKDLSHWNDRNSEESQAAITASLISLRIEFLTTIGMILFLGALASYVGFLRISRIQRRNEASHQRIAEARAKLKSLSNQLVSAQEVERKALSRELHDEIGQSLTALKLELARSEKLARKEGSGVVESLQAIRAIADQTLRATKSISLGLRPPMLDDLGLAAALNWFTTEYSNRTGITVELEADGEIGRLSEAHRTCVYRIVQEALTNCARHAGAKRIQIRLDAGDEQLRLSISDDGAGFEQKAKTGSGLGLIGMQERAAELGGVFEILSAAGKGTSIRIMIPVG